MSERQGQHEEFEVAGEHLLAKVRELIHEGNVRRISIRSEEGDTLLEIPLTAGVAATALTAALAPILVPIAALAALLSRATVVVERRDA
jgi:hypothetical protein